MSILPVIKQDLQRNSRNDMNNTMRSPTRSLEFTLLCHRLVTDSRQVHVMRCQSCLPALEYMATP